MKVLIADDNDDFLKVMEELIKSQGYVPLLAQDGKQAREILEEHTVDVIISDVFMPTLDGIRFHSYVREFMGERTVPFIFMSGYDDPYTRDALEDETKDFFISKLTPMSRIIEILESINTKAAS
jgi:CheY-like chemotaxis protein